MDWKLLFVSVGSSYRFSLQAFLSKPFFRNLRALSSSTMAAKSWARLGHQLKYQVGVKIALSLLFWTISFNEVQAAALQALSPKAAPTPVTTPATAKPTASPPVATPSPKISPPLSPSTPTSASSPQSPTSPAGWLPSLQILLGAKLHLKFSGRLTKIEV